MPEAFFGKYAVYIIPAYAVSAVVIAGMVAWTRMQYRARLKQIETLEKQGVARRAGKRAGARK